MVWLPDGEKIWKILLFALTESTNVTDTAWRHWPRICMASRGKNRPILMKFGTLQQILNPMTVSWPKIEFLKIQTGGDRRLENRFYSHNSSTDCPISVKFCTRKLNSMPTKATWQKLQIFTIQNGGRPKFWKSFNHHISVKKISDFYKIWCTTADMEPNDILKSTIAVS